MASVRNFPDHLQRCVDTLQARLAMCYNLLHVNDLVKTLKANPDDSDLTKKIADRKELLTSAAHSLSNLMAASNEISTKRGNYKVALRLAQKTLYYARELEKEFQLHRSSTTEIISVIRDLHTATEIYLQYPDIDADEVLRAAEDLRSPPAENLTKCDVNIQEDVETPPQSTTTKKKKKKPKKNDPVPTNGASKEVCSSLDPMVKSASTSTVREDVASSTKMADTSESKGHKIDEKTLLDSGAASASNTASVGRQETISKAQKLSGEALLRIEKIEEMLRLHHLAHGDSSDPTKHDSTGAAVAIATARELQEKIDSLIEITNNLFSTKAAETKTSEKSPK